MRRIAGALALAAVLTACGTTDWSSTAATSARTAKSAAAARAARAAAAAERPYVDALVVNARMGTVGESAPPPPATVRCLATAIVHTYGRVGFTRAGITPAALRRPGADIDALPLPTPAQVTALGAALQRCRLGKLLAPSFALELKVSGAAATCLQRRFDVDPGVRRFLALSALERGIDLASAHGLVDVMAQCTDLAQVILNEADLHADETTRSCLLDSLRNIGPELKDLLAETMVHGKPAADQLDATVGVAINRCRPSAHTGFTVPTD